MQMNEQSTKQVNKINQAIPLHGGESFGEKPEYDFSVNTNALPLPKTVWDSMQKALAECDRYPEYDSLKLTRALSEHLHVSEEKIVFGNGSSELFMAVVHALKPQKTLIPVPSFYGYEYAASAEVGSIDYFSLSEADGFCLNREFEENLNVGFDLLFLGNPNNPTGRMIPEDALTSLLDAALRSNTKVVLDECFYEFTGASNGVFQKTEQYPNLILVNSFTKTYSIPGIRLGYLVCSDSELVAKIKKHLPEWNLSNIAQVAGLQCLKEEEYLRRSVACVKEERDYLTKSLRGLGIKVFDSDTNFILFYCECNLGVKLLEKGILIRDASNFRGLEAGFWRIAVRTHSENEILVSAMRDIIGDRR